MSRRVRLEVHSASDQERRHLVLASQPSAYEASSTLARLLHSDILNQSRCNLVSRLAGADMLHYRSSLADHLLVGTPPGVPAPNLRYAPTALFPAAPSTLFAKSALNRTSLLIQNDVHAHNFASLTTSSASVQDPFHQLHNAALLQDNSLVTPAVLAAAASPLTSSRFEQAGAAQLRKRGAESFPVILHRALVKLDLITTGGDKIASFLPDGKSFQIWNQQLFEKKIIPIYFPKMTSFASFQRQLNLYDFQRTGGTSLHRGNYRHHMFDRASPELARQMKRRKIKGAIGSSNKGVVPAR